MAIYCETGTKAAETKMFGEIMPVEHAVYLWMSYLWLNKVCPSEWIDVVLGLTLE